MADMEKSNMDERLQNSINFLRSAYLQAKENGKPFSMDEETLKILLDLLKDCKMMKEVIYQQCLYEEMTGEKPDDYCERVMQKGWRSGNEA